MGFSDLVGLVLLDFNFEISSYGCSVLILNIYVGMLCSVFKFQGEFYRAYGFLFTSQLLGSLLHLW